MSHEVDGFDLSFTSRRGWKAARFLAGQQLDIVPVTWTKGLRTETAEQSLEVWFSNQDELEEYATRKTPFVVAVAAAKDYQQHPHTFSKFVALYEVAPTGERLSDHSIKTRIIARVAASEGALATRKKIARISYNSEDWRKPSGDAAKLEGQGTYNRQYGFGHEDWLFRDEWQVAGWRYAFLQGVNKSHAKLTMAGEPFDVTLFTVEPDKRRRYVATIREVECLNDVQAAEALKVFEARGWLDLMKKEIAAAGGNPGALGEVEWAKHILNIRFRLDDVSYFDKGAYIATNSPVLQFNRYLLYEASAGQAAQGLPTRSTRSGSPLPPAAASYTRRGTGAVEVSPEHIIMQANLMTALLAEFPGARVVREENFVDVLVETETDRFLYEIKSDLSPLRVLRQAIGQLLEYAYLRPGDSKKTIRLVAVGRSPLSGEAEIYLQRLQKDFSLPLEYRVVGL